MFFSFLLAAGTLCPTGCGSNTMLIATTATTTLAVTPSTTTVDVGGMVTLTSVGPHASDSCAWDSSDQSILTVGGGGIATVATAIGPGVATASVVCGNEEANSAVSVASTSTAIRITKGGTYTGNWRSDDPNTPAVLIITDDPVTITNSTITGRGDLIRAYGHGKANLTVTRTTGIGLDPGVAGKPRGDFVAAENMDVVTVTNCTMRGVSFGIYIAGAKMSTLTIKNNVGTDFDDRLSDGNGGTQLNKRQLGHFIMLNQVALQKSSEIAWNQVIDTPGVASVEDIINIYQSHGSSNLAPLVIHDNYLEGAFATGYTLSYTGVGVQFDGGTNDPAQASGFTIVQNNVVVHTAQGGFSIGAGHDITMTGNRVVSCGQDDQGHWLNFGGSAFGMWNYYNTQQFYNNIITASTGGLVNGSNGKPTISDMFSPSVSDALQDVIRANHFEDPCLVDGVLSQAAEAKERVAWVARVAGANQTLGR